MSEISRHSDELLATVIIIATIGIAVGVGIVITSQFENISIRLPNGTNVNVVIPEQLKLQNFTPFISLGVMLLIIMLVVGIVFGLVIPKLKEATSR